MHPSKFHAQRNVCLKSGKSVRPPLHPLPSSDYAQIFSHRPLKPLFGSNLNEAVYGSNAVGEGVPARRAGVSLGEALKTTKDGSDGDLGR